MNFATIFVLAFVALCNAGHHEDHFAPAHYNFEYGVSNPHTGDKKYQHETRDGDVVKGVYSLHEPDGTIRVVEYSSHPHHGFDAVVKRIGHASHPVHYGHGHGDSHGAHGGHGDHGHGGASSYVGITHFGAGALVGHH